MNIYIFFQMAPQKSFVRKVIFTYERLLKVISIKVGKETLKKILFIALGFHGSEKPFRRYGLQSVNSVLVTM